MPRHTSWKVVTLGIALGGLGLTGAGLATADSPSNPALAPIRVVAAESAASAPAPGATVVATLPDDLSPESADSPFQSPVDSADSPFDSPDDPRPDHSAESADSPHASPVDTPDDDTLDDDPDDDD